MRRLWTTFALAAALATLQAAPALAADGFETFRAACLDTHGERKAALAVVDAAGWKDMPIGAVPTSNMNFKLKDAVARSTGEAKDQRVLLVGDGETIIGGRPTPAQICFIAGAGLGGAAATAKSAIKLEPIMTMNMPNAAQGAPMNMSIYAFRETSSGRVAVPVSELAAPTTPFVMLMVIGGDQSPMGMLGRFAISPAAPAQP